MVSGMTEEEKQDIFQTTDKEKIKEIILRGVDGIETTTDIEEMFGVKYCHIYE